MANYRVIPIIDAAKRVGLRILPQTLGYTEVQACCPFCQDGKYHLSLNVHKNVFQCNRCKTSGNSVTLYAKLMHADNKTAYRELTRGNVYGFQPPPQSKQQAEREPKPLHIRHDVYYDMLKMLGLDDRHRENLMGRGLSQQRIERNMYRSVPVKREHIAEVADLLSDNYDLTGIPGFYTKNGRWTMYARPGFFIPVCTAEGYIQGLQIRLDQAEKRKYRWLSSRYEENGTRVYSWAHVTGNRDSETVCVTEGALKADAASTLSRDALFVAVPGVNCLDHLAEVLRHLSVSKVSEMFDMDKMQNPNVAQAVAKLEPLIRGLGLEYRSWRWNLQYKGIDDYLLNRKAG